MTRKTTLVLLIIFATSSFFFGTNAKAYKDIESVYRFRGPAKHIYSQIEFLPILEMIQPRRRPRVERALAEGDCGIALGHLYQSIFYNTHKHVPSPFNSTDGLRAWRGYVLPQHYPGLNFCETARRLGKAEIKFRASGETQIFMRQKRIPGRDPVIYFALSQVYSVLNDLIILAIEDYPPAQLMLAKLSSEERYLRLTPAYAYYLLSRATINGLKDPDLAPLYEASKAVLSDKARNALAPLVKSGHWPREWPLVRD